MEKSDPLHCHKDSQAYARMTAMTFKSATKDLSVENHLSSSILCIIWKSSWVRRAGCISGCHWIIEVQNLS
jgi:hypothetical protein